MNNRRLFQSYPDRRPSRRSMVCQSGAGALALNLWGLLRAQTAAACASKAGSDLSTDLLPRIRACIFVFYYGGPSHLETWDLKPSAPSTVRGEFNPVATSAPGVQICEHLPMMARVMHRVAIVRSMHHTNRLHDSASTETFTGRQGPKGDREEFGPIPQFFPSHGAVLSALRPRTGEPVTHAALPWLFHNVITTPCQGGGFLGQQFDPFEISGDSNLLRYRMEVLQRQEHMTPDRLQLRRSLLSQFTPSTSSFAQITQAGQLDQFTDRAYELLQSDRLLQALDLESESAATRERYGMQAAPSAPEDSAAALAAGRNLRGQNLLLARRLVEAGVPFVNVNDFRQQGQNWDSHADHFRQSSKYLLPQADRALSALIEDLDDRGLLDSTLVVALGEFGRTPTINGTAGRDHWPDCYSIVLAGGGVRGGSIFGSSDRLGAYPETDPVTPADLAATIYWRFGINPATEVHDTTGRPYRLSDGSPIRAIFG